AEFEENKDRYELDKVIAFRTDTFYGLGADPFNSDAVARIRALKGREDDKPILLLIADLAQLDRLIVERSVEFDKIAARFWPGPLTIIGKAVDDLPDEITAGTGTVGVRLPNDESVRKLVRDCGGVLTATSANPAGQSPARSAAEVRAYFPEGIYLIIDGGEVTATEPSTVLDATTSPPRIVREGAIRAADLIAHA
ncbi:MAG TPA: L-threonylcarbamoyladenylate synthase, partial [Pyrinomonadaceae bacterium]|nr:L-threonylcarbamoyladenylate synthase [Pyrinomonadaceae bacterium]